MNEKTSPNSSDLSKSSKSRENDYVDIFRYFETANMRNHNAFCELVDYTAENYKEPGE